MGNVCLEGVARIVCAVDALRIHTTGGPYMSLIPLPSSTSSKPSARPTHLKCGVEKLLCPSIWVQNTPSQLTLRWYVTCDLYPVDQPERRVSGIADY
jgi:hypothetical protein